jgi:hypothetical protein
MDKLGDQILLGAIFIFGGLVGYIMLIVPMANRSQGSARADVLKIKKRTYTYELGDNLLRFGGASFFSGMDIHLPKALPHIFLDAQANDPALQRAEYIFEDDDKVSLEGDFDKYFQAYVPKEHKQLALSILTPDVLQVLKRSAFKYDIEIMDRHVRLIISTDNVLMSRNEKMQDDILKAARAVMKEIDERLQTWQESSLTGDTALDVKKVNKHFKR